MGTSEEPDRIQTIWTQLKHSSAFDERRQAIQLFNAQHPHRKRGLAITPVKFGISFTATLFNQVPVVLIAVFAREEPWWNVLGLVIGDQ